MNSKQDKKITSEDQSRINLLFRAKCLGCEEDVRKIFRKYDSLLQKCTNKSERDQISILGLVELHKLLDCSQPLMVNDREIVPGNPEPNAELKLTLKV